MTHPHAGKFSFSLQVKEQDIDVLGHVNNVVYLQYVQEVAAAHWQAAAPPAMQQKCLWVVLRHEIDYLLPAFLHEQIVGYTWVGAHQGARFDRFVHLHRAATDELLAKAKTTWCLLDAATRRPRRIDEAVLAIL